MICERSIATAIGLQNSLDFAMLQNRVKNASRHAV